MSGINLHTVPGYENLKAFKHGGLWYIVDCMPGNGDPYKNVIGPFFESLGSLIAYVEQMYLPADWTDKALLRGL